MRFIFLATALFALSCSAGKDRDNVIEFWQFWSDMNTKPVVEQLAREFEGSNPGVKIKITDLTWANGHDKLVISFAGKKPPDIMELGSDWISEFSSNGLLAELNSDLSEKFLSPAIWDGKLYALPWLLDTRIIYINLNLLEKADLAIPTDWTELLAACEKIDVPDDDIFGFGCNSAEKHRLYKKFLPFLWSNGGQVISDDGRRSELDSEAAIKSLEYYSRLCDCGLIESQRRLEEYFCEGKIGFVISGGWLLRRLRAYPPAFHFGLVPFFTPDGKTGLSFFGGEYIAVSAGSQKKDIVKKFAAFLAAKTNSQKLCDAAGFGFPPYPDLDFADPEKAILARQLSCSISTPPSPLWVDIEMDLEDAIESAIYHHGTPKDIFIEASKNINAKLKSAGYADK